MAASVTSDSGSPLIVSRSRSDVSTHNSRSYHVVRQGDDCAICGPFICILFFVSLVALCVAITVKH